ncbi:MAG: hypothetical protein ABSC08_10490 [Bryobacteraceae bacterium]|jgi:hypothetical protein
MKAVAATLVLLLVAGFAAFAADIDGKWKAETKRPSRDGSGEITITMLFDLKADGAKLTGNVTLTGPWGERQAAVSDGKIDGNKFSFTTTTEGPNGTMTTKYEGTVEGSALKGTSAREGGQRSFPFEAKKQ